LNPMPESVTDRPTKAHEYIFLLSKSSSYHYDADAIREPSQIEEHGRYDMAKNGIRTGLGYLQQGPLASNSVKTAKLNYQNAKVLASNSRNQLQQQVELAWENLRSAYGQYKGYVEQVKAYGESFRTAEIRFNAGAITSVDYVIAKNNFDRANINLSVARYAYIFRTKILEYYQGRLSF